MLCLSGAPAVTSRRSRDSRHGAQWAGILRFYIMSEVVLGFSRIKFCFGLDKAKSEVPTLEINKLL
jgi:hypothetical protein